jgi:hypothetical protein
VRFELPARYRHFRDVSVRYARWDLSRVDLVDPRTGTILAPLYPLDRQANADGQRRLFELDTLPGESTPPPGDDQPPAEGQPQTPRPSTPPPLPPLLQQLLAEYSATGTPPAYLPQSNPADTGASS